MQRALVLAIALTACENAVTAPAPTASVALTEKKPAPTATSVSPVVTVPVPTNVSNPLHLPARHLKLDPGRRVFAASEAMLNGAKVGSTLVLFAATVAGLDGDDFVIEGRGGPSYRVHPAYVVAVPDDAHVKPGDAVITEWAGVMRHGVVTKMIKDRINVHFTDLDPKAPEATLKNTARFVRQVEGLEPGSYASLAREGELEHVLLVSPYVDGITKRWLVLGFGGAALLVDEVDLAPIPIRLSPKVGATVLAESTGKMRRATVESIESQGIFTVKFDRAGRPSTVGWGLLMPAPKEIDAGAP